MTYKIRTPKHEIDVPSFGESSLFALDTGRAYGIWEGMDYEAASELRRLVGDDFEAINALAREGFVGAVTVVHFVSPAWCEAMLGTSDLAEARERCAEATGHLTAHEGDALAVFVELATDEAKAGTVESLGSTYLPLSQSTHGAPFVERVQELLREALDHAFVRVPKA